MSNPCSMPHLLIISIFHVVVFSTLCRLASRIRCLSTSSWRGCKPCKAQVPAAGKSEAPRTSTWAGGFRIHIWDTPKGCMNIYAAIPLVDFRVDQLLQRNCTRPALYFMLLPTLCVCMGVLNVWPDIE